MTERMGAFKLRRWGSLIRSLSQWVVVVSCGALGSWKVPHRGWRFIGLNQELHSAMLEGDRKVWPRGQIRMAFEE